MIRLKMKLADDTHVDIEELAEHIQDTDTLTLFLKREVVIHPESLQWTEGDQSFEDAETNNVEGEDGSGGYIPYDELGTPVRDLHPDEQADMDEDDYYYQIETAEWEGDSDFESFVAEWMNENKDSYKDLVTNGCVSGMVSKLVYHSQVLDCIREHKRELEMIVQDIAENLGDMDFLFGLCEYNKRDFSFDRLVWMCFEETVRQTVGQLDLSDI